MVGRGGAVRAGGAGAAHSTAHLQIFFGNARLHKFAGLLVIAGLQAGLELLLLPLIPLPLFLRPPLSIGRLILCTTLLPLVGRAAPHRLRAM